MRLLESGLSKVLRFVVLFVILHGVFTMCYNTSITSRAQAQRIPIEPLIWVYKRWKFQGIDQGIDRNDRRRSKSSHAKFGTPTMQFVICARDN